MTYTLVKRRRKSGAVVYYATADAGRTYTRLARSGPAPDHAERLRAKHEAHGALGALNAGGPEPRAPADCTVGAVLREYIVDVRDNRPEPTYRRTRPVCATFLAWAGEDRRFSDLTALDLQKWLDWRSKQSGLMGGNVSPNTLRKELSILAGLWEWATARGLAKSNAPATLKPPAPAQPRRVWGETSHVLEAIRASAGHPGRYAAVYVLAATGMRIGELRSLLWSDVDLRAGVVSLRAIGPQTTKRHERLIPIGPGCVAALEATRGQRELVFATGDGRRPLTSQLVLWLKPLTPHSLRRWYQTQLELLQAPSYVIDDLMGHASPIRAAYANGTPLELRRPWGEKIDAILQPAIQPQVPGREHDHGLALANP